MNIDPNPAEFTLILELLRGAFADHLLKPEWRAKKTKDTPNSAGHCYAASEALYHALGFKAAG